MDIIRKFEPIFGIWHAESLIGTGSFGRVYKIYREELGHRYYSALKYISLPASESEMRPLRMNGMDDVSLSSYYGDMAHDIAEEAAVMYSLRGSENIVAFEDSRIEQKPDGIGYDIFIRMELLESLTARIANQGLPPKEEVVRIGKDMCRALSVCADQGIIHRDIKPDNIFISPRGSYKLGDFGIARHLDKTTDNMSKKGTYNYMAPEVFKGEEYGATCDIYSLGIVLYRFLNGGRLPFMPNAPQAITPNDIDQALPRRMRGETLPAPINADPELAAIVLKACAYRPQDRFRSAREMLGALNAIGTGRLNAFFTPPVDPSVNAGGTGEGTVRLRRPSGNPVVVKPTPAPPIDRRPEIEKDTKKGKNNTALIAVIAALFVAVAVLAGILSSNAFGSCGKKDPTYVQTSSAPSIITDVSTPDPYESYTALPVTVPPTTPPTDPPTTPPTNPPTTPPVTPVPEVLATQDFVTSGKYYLRSVSGGKYLNSGGVKKNLSGDKGNFLIPTTDKYEALFFTVEVMEGSTCRLFVGNISDGGKLCLDAYQPTEDTCGADIWGVSHDEDQGWVIERLSDGTYIIYLGKYGWNRCLTAEAFNNDGFSVRSWNGSATQRWELVVANNGY